MSEHTNVPNQPPSEQPPGGNRRRLYVVVVVLVAVVAGMLGSVMFGANRLAFRQQLLGTWSSPEQSGQTESRRITVEFFDNSTYRWVTEEANNEVIDRGHYTIVGTNQVRFEVSASAGQTPSTPAIALYMAEVIADHLSLRNEQQTITLELR